MEDIVLAEEIGKGAAGVVYRGLWREMNVRHRIFHYIYIYIYPCGVLDGVVYGCVCRK